MTSSDYPQGTWVNALTFEEQAAHWLWHGFVSRRSLTLLTGLWK
jgi:hypothetical protein